MISSLDFVGMFKIFDLKKPQNTTQGGTAGGTGNRTQNISTGPSAAYLRIQKGKIAVRKQ